MIIQAVIVVIDPKREWTGNSQFKGNGVRRYTGGLVYIVFFFGVLKSDGRTLDRADVMHFALRIIFATFVRDEQVNAAILRLLGCRD